MRLGSLGKKEPARTGKAKAAPPATGSSVIFPGPEAWEIWSGPSGQAVCSGSAELPGKLRAGPGSVMGLPSRSFFSMPLWVPVVEDSPAREQTQIKLEMKGMLGAVPDSAVWSFEGIRREQGPPGADGETVARQLESTAVLATPFPEEWLVEETVRHEPAGRMLAAPAGGACGVLRRELGKWVADFYQGGKWLHTQPLLAESLDASAAVELAATEAQLAGEGILGAVDAWLIRDAVSGVSAELSRGLSAPVRLEQRVAPAPVREAWSLPPPALTELRLRRAAGARRTRMIRLGLAIYLGVIFLLAGVLAWPVARLHLLRRELGRIGPDADNTRKTALLWREAGAWLEPKRNALELLWQISRPLIETDPAKIEGVRLTLFDLNSKRLLLQGEGRDLELVEKYLQWLKAEPGLAGFTWKNPQPRLLPNGNAQFQAEGILPGASAEAGEGGEANANPDAP